MAKKFPPAPKNPERICWGCDKYCAATDMRCGNGSDRTQHPVELLGEDWQDWRPLDAPADAAAAGREAGDTGAEEPKTPRS